MPAPVDKGRRAPLFPSAAPPDVKQAADPVPRPWWRGFGALAPFLAMLPLAAYMLLLLLGIHLERRADRQDDVQRTAAALAAGLDSELRAGQRALEALAGSQHLTEGDLSAFRQEAQRLLAREPFWFTIALTDGERQLLNLRYPEGATLPPIQDLTAVGSVLRTGYAAPGGLVEGRVSFRVPVRVDGAVRFALVATQEATTFAQLLDHAALPPGWSALLLDGNGRLIARAAAGQAEPETLRLASERRNQLVEVDGLMALSLPVGEGRWSLVVAAPPRDFVALAVSWMVLALTLAVLLAGLGIGIRLLRHDQGHSAQHQHRQSEALARAAEQERRRNEMMAAVSQELRTPLAGMLHYGDQLAGTDLSPQARLWVEQQRLAGRALLTLVEDVLDFTRLEDGSIKLEDTDIDIGALLADCAALMQGAAQAKGLTLLLEPDAGLPRWIRGDPMRLRQVVTKLLDNAIRVAGRGQVVLAARLTPRPERIEIAVHDNGPGIGEAEKGRLFERFREASPGGRGGSGLGLALCRRLVEAMGGAIGAETMPDRRTRFVFWVPFRPGASPALAQGGRPLRILVAEDVAASRLLLTAVLERAGHLPSTAVDGTSALEALRAGRFDMALLDLHMPSLGGLGVAKAVRALEGEASRIPLIALTADPADQMEESCRAAGFDSVLRKPFDTPLLLGVIDGLRSKGLQAPTRTEAGA